MITKKFAACLLICGFAHNAQSMEYLGGAVTYTAGAVRSGFIAVKEKANPTGIFDIVHDKWDTKDDRGKVTYLHKLDRGFLDGFLQEPNGDPTKLLDAIEATVPKYPICAQTLDLVHQFLGQKLPVLVRRPDLLKRAITAMYLLRPERLAPDITNKTFTNYVTDKAVREAIVSSVVGTLITRENAKESNTLVQTLQQHSAEVPFGTHAQITLKAFLAKAATESLSSCTYIDGLGNTQEDDPINAELTAGRERLGNLQARLQAVQEVNTREEQALQARSEALAQRSAQLAAQKAEQERRELEYAQQAQAFAQRAQAFEQRQRELAAQLADQEQREQALAQQVQQQGQRPQGQQPALVEQAQQQPPAQQQPAQRRQGQQAAAPHAGNQSPINVAVDLSPAQAQKGQPSSGDSNKRK